MTESWSPPTAVNKEVARTKQQPTKQGWPTHPKFPKVDAHPMIAEKRIAAHRVTKKEYEKLAAFRFNLRQFLRFSELAARSVGLTSQQHQALLSIKGFPDGKVITIGELAEQLQVAHHTAVELVDRLTLQDLVLREASTVDRRHVHIKLTDRGVEILEALTWVHREELRRLSKRLNSLF
jgi:DNA-binding MarR family transcriptional regulator